MGKPLSLIHIQMCIRDRAGTEHILLAMLKETESVATRQQFRLLNEYVKRKISDIRGEILSGDTEAVSYTHLDVYKRQVKTQAADGTALETMWESRWPPDQKKKNRETC